MPCDTVSGCELAVDSHDPNAKGQRDWQVDSQGEMGELAGEMRCRSRDAPSACVTILCFSPSGDLVPFDVDCCRLR
jgi:hypothetical protein